MAKKNTGFEVVSLTGKPMDTFKLKARKFINTPLRTICILKATASALTSHFMANATPKKRRNIQNIATKVLGSADSFNNDTYTDQLLNQAIHENITPLICDILSENATEMSHRGLVHNIAFLECYDKINLIPNAVKSFMANSKGLEENFRELPDLLLCQNKINNIGGGPKLIHRQILLDFVESYSSDFTHSMLMDCLSESIKKDEEECFDKLVELNVDKITSTDQKTLQTMRDDIAEKARERRELYSNNMKP